MGVVATDKALIMARDKGLDLVEVAPTATPPVCKIIDYGKYRYEQTRKDRKARSGQRSGLLKEVRVRPQVKDHDLEIKINQAKKFILAGDKVKVLRSIPRQANGPPGAGCQVTAEGSQRP